MEAYERPHYVSVRELLLYIIYTIYIFFSQNYTLFFFFFAATNIISVKHDSKRATLTLAQY